MANAAAQAGATEADPTARVRGAAEPRDNRLTSRPRRRARCASACCCQRPNSLTRRVRLRLSRRPSPCRAHASPATRAAEQARSYPKRPHHRPSGPRTARQPAKGARSRLWSRLDGSDSRGEPPFRGRRRSSPTEAIRLEFLSARGRVLAQPSLDGRLVLRRRERLVRAAVNSAALRAPLVVAHRALRNVEPARYRSSGNSSAGQNVDRHDLLGAKAARHPPVLPAPRRAGNPSGPPAASRLGRCAKLAVP